jgi:hypothetical protein
MTLNNYALLGKHSVGGYGLVVCILLMLCMRLELKLFKPFTWSCIRISLFVEYSPCGDIEENRGTRCKNHNPKRSHRIASGHTLLTQTQKVIHGLYYRLFALIYSVHHPPQTLQSLNSCQQLPPLTIPTHLRIAI